MEKLLHDLAEHLGGKVDEICGPLPDGTGFATMSFPLPKDHWLLINPDEAHIPPMPIRMGEGQRLMIGFSDLDDPNDAGMIGVTISKRQFEKMLQAAGRYAVRATTSCDKVKDFDPDAMVRNFINGVVGYCTDNGLSGDGPANPSDQDPKRKFQINQVLDDSYSGIGEVGGHHRLSEGESLEQ